MNLHVGCSRQIFNPWSHSTSSLVFFSSWTFVYFSLRSTKSSRPPPNHCKPAAFLLVQNHPYKQSGKFQSLFNGIGGRRYVKFKQIRKFIGQKSPHWNPDLLHRHSDHLLSLHPQGDNARHFSSIMNWMYYSYSSRSRRRLVLINSSSRH